MDSHYLDDCGHQLWARSCVVVDNPEDLSVDEWEPFDESNDLAVPPVQVNQLAFLCISIVQSPLLTSVSQMAHQADGVIPMDVIGKVYCSLTRGQWSFKIDALVVCQLDVNILPGNPFIVHNDFRVHPSKHQSLRLWTTAHPPDTPVNLMCGVHNSSCYATETALLFRSVALLTLTPTPGGPLSLGQTALLTCHVNHGLHRCKFSHGSCRSRFQHRRLPNSSKERRVNLPGLTPHSYWNLHIHCIYHHIMLSLLLQPPASPFHSLWSLTLMGALIRTPVTNSWLSNWSNYMFKCPYHHAIIFEGIPSGDLLNTLIFFPTVITYYQVTLS